MQLQVPTLMVASTLLSGSLGLMWLCLSRSGSGVAGLRDWGLAHVLFCAGIALLALRPALQGAVPPALAYVLLLVSTGLAWSGMRQFDGDAPRLPMACAGALLWLLLGQLPGVTGAPVLYTAVVPTLISLYGLATAWQVFRRWADMRLFRAILLASFCLHSMLMLVRVGFTLGSPPSWAAGQDGGLALALLGGMLHAVTASFALLALPRGREQQRAVAEIVGLRDSVERANAAKSRFLARMSHELRTPLNGVLGLAQVLASDHSLPAGARGHGTTIEHAGRHLLALVNDVLDLSQVEAGRLHFEHQPVPLGPLASSAAVLLGPEAARKPIDLQVALAPGCPQVVMGDAVRLRQLLLNLLGNAVKFTPPGGAVRLVLSALDGGGLRIAVSDTGPGIPVAQRALLFRDFTQMPPTPGAAQEGNGLGLAISAGLVAAMSGRIGMTPGAGGQGSLFWVELPLCVAAPAPAPPPQCPGNTRRILVVDDVALNRLVVQALLESAEHEVMMAEDGQEALALLAQHSFDLVLMDVQMPVMDGLEATRRIRHAEATQEGRHRATIVALTGGETQEEVRACLDAGMDGHLAKPTDRAKLLALLHRMTGPGATGPGSTGPGNEAGRERLWPTG